MAVIVTEVLVVTALVAIVNGITETPEPAPTEPGAGATAKLLVLISTVAPLGGGDANVIAALTCALPPQTTVGLSESVYGSRPGTDTVNTAPWWCVPP